MTEHKQAALPPVINRYELKFTIPEDMVEDIEDFIRPYCRLDKYSALTEDHYYEVNSLYLDTPEFLFLRARLERAERRFNIRVRSYGLEPGFPYFLEIKHKKVEMINKYRCRVDKPGWESRAARRAAETAFDGVDPEVNNKKIFWELVKIYNAEPKVLMQYRRKAYLSMYEDYARVTFDKKLTYIPEHRFFVQPPRGEMAPCDFVTCFDPGCSVILELKCYTSHVPWWMMDLIRRFDLQRRGVSKYTMGVSQVMDRFRYDGAVRQAAVG